MTETLNIVKLVEDNPLIKFNNIDYQPKLVGKLCKKFSTDEQQLFLASFYCYLNCDNNEFSVSLRDHWKWLGFSRFDPALRLVKNEFTVDKDYKILLHGSVEKKGSGGHNRQDIKMTIRTWKKLCLKARTKKADEIHDYYLNLEEFIHELFEEKAKELTNLLKVKDQTLVIKEQELRIKELEARLLQKDVQEKQEIIETKDIQLEKKQEIIENKENKIISVLSEREQGLVETFKKKKTFYIGIVEVITKFGKTIYIIKFGISGDIETRLYRHKQELCSNFTFSYVYESHLNKEIESEIKKVHKDRRLFKEYNAKNQTELLQLDDDFTLEDLHQSILEIKGNLEDEDNKTKQAKIDQLKEKVSKLEKKNQFIARNLTTGEEIVFKSYESARKISGIGPHSIKDNYLNKPKQSRGWTYRTEGSPYWQPPENYKFNPAFKPSASMVKCKSTEIATGKVTLYNSVIEAAHFIKLHKDDDTKSKRETNRRTLNRTINGGETIHPIIGKYSWERIDRCGDWVYPCGKRTPVSSLN